MNHVANMLKNTKYNSVIMNEKIIMSKKKNQLFSSFVYKDNYNYRKNRQFSNFAEPPPPPPEDDKFLKMCIASVTVGLVNTIYYKRKNGK